MDNLIKKNLELIREASKKGWDLLSVELNKNSIKDLVDYEFNAEYDELGHDIVIDYSIKTKNDEDIIVAIFSMNKCLGIWIPELRPWVQSVNVYSKENNLKESRGRLYDSKWTEDDKDRDYEASVWGYIDRKGEILKFGPFEKKYVSVGP